MTENDPLPVRHRAINLKFQAVPSFVRGGPLGIIGLGPCNAEQAFAG